MNNFTYSQTLELAKQIEEENPKQLIVPAKLTKSHHLINEAKSHYKTNKKLSHWEPYTVSLGDKNLSIRVTKQLLSRSLIWFNAFIKLADVRGHKVYMDGTKTMIEIKEIQLNVHLREKNKANYDNKQNWYDSRTLEPTGILCFSFYKMFTQKEWYDAKTVKLEDKLGIIMAFLELKAEDEIQRKIEREEFHHKWEEEKALKAEQEANVLQEKEKYNDLINRAERWDQYKKVTNYLDMVEDKNLESQDWLSWAKQKVDWIDPRKNTLDDILGEYD